MKQTDRYAEISIDVILQPETSVREEVDADHVLELANSMAKHGLLEPIIVREATNGNFCLIAGNHRLLAAKHLGWNEISAMVRIGEPTGRDHALATIENIARKQMTLPEECEAVRHLYEDEKLSPSAICSLIGKSRSWVDRRLAAPNLPSKVRAALFEGRISVGAAEIIGAVENEGARNSILAEAIYAGRSISEIQSMAEMWRKIPDLGNAVEEGVKVSAEQQTPQERRGKCSLCGTTRPLREIIAIAVCAFDCEIQEALKVAQKQLT